MRPLLHLDDAPFTFRQARWKVALLAACGIGFVALGWALVFRAPADAGAPAWEVRAAGWAAMLFFAPCTVAAAIQLVRPSGVTIAREGLTTFSPFSRRSRPWSELSGFRLWSHRGTTLILYDDADPARRRGLAGFNRRLVGASDAIPSPLNIDVDRLYVLLVEARLTWGRADAPE